MADGKTILMEKKAVDEMKEEAERLKVEFRGYLEDLELYSKKEFWDSVREAQKGKATKYKSIEEFKERMCKK